MASLGKEKAMKHWHFKLPSFRPFAHSHPGGDKVHRHKNARGYGKKKSTLKIRLSPGEKRKIEQSGVISVAGSVIGFATVSRLVSLLR